MALRGTLKDFGIADIFQLIGHQGKSGKLAVRSRNQEVNIFFREGNIVRAMPGSRDRKDLLGAILVRGEVISQKQLEAALEIQKASKQRLGEILIETTPLDSETFQTFFKLQTTETLYRAFLWGTGSYEFSSMDVQADDDAEMIRSENVLMEGFRQADEWPNIRRKVSGYGMVFDAIEDLDDLAAEEQHDAGDEPEDPFAGLDDAFDEFDLGGGGGSSGGRLKNIRDNERLVYALIDHDRDVQKIIDLSRLGEFETCKALLNLIEAEIIEPLPEGGHHRPSADATVGGITSDRSQWARLALRAGVLLAIVAGIWVGGKNLGLDTTMLWTSGGKQGYQGNEIRNLLSRDQVYRLRAALAVYHSQRGQYPAELAELSKAGLIDAEAIRFPWRTDYYYAPAEGGYVLLPPLR